MKKDGFGIFGKKAVLLVGFLLLLTSGYAQQQIIATADDIEDALRRHVMFVTADSLQGRPAGSPGEERVAEYIYDELLKSGVTMISPRTGDDFYISLRDLGLPEKEGMPDTLHSRNVIGVVPGYDKNLREEYIVIGAHIDHLGVHKINVNGEEQVQIYPGADDNASGVATLLEVARQISASRFLFKRSVIFAFFGAEELGMLGSWYFLNRSFQETDNIVAMINLDMVGRSGNENKIQVYTVAPNWIFNSLVKELSSRPLSLQTSTLPTDCFPSDHRLFYEKNIPVMLFTSGVHRDYHTLRDRPGLLDYKQMEKLTEFVSAAALNIADRVERIADSFRTADPSVGEKEPVYTQYDVDKKAQFLHGDERQFLDKWVYPYVKYPDSAVAAGETGTVIVNFIVEKDGRVSHVEVVRGVSDDIDDEVMKVISASPKWKAAQLKGTPVRVKISVPVEFRLSNSSAKLRLK